MYALRVFMLLRPTFLHKLCFPLDSYRKALRGLQGYCMCETLPFVMHCAISSQGHHGKQLMVLHNNRILKEIKVLRYHVDQRSSNNSS
jgi:hypothetical protein